MEFRPKNKYLLVQPVDETKPENKTSGFILPEDYKKVEIHKLVKILSASGDSQYFGLKNALAVIPANMMEQIKVTGEVYYVVPETAVYGVLLN